MVQAAGGRVMVWGIFSWSILEPLVPTERPLNTTVCPTDTSLETETKLNEN